MRFLPGLRTRMLILSWSLLALLTPAHGQEKRDQTSEQADEILRIKTDLVQTSVTVFDDRGRFVEGLRPEQFELSLDGKPQPITFFEQVTAGSPAEEKRLTTLRGDASPSSAAKAPSAPASRGRTIVFFIDDLHLSLSSLERTRLMLTRFIEKEMGQDDLAAIASTSGQLGFLQQFTDNKSVLRTAVQRLVHRPYNVRDMSRESTPMTEYMALSIERKDDPGVLNFYTDECLKYALPRYPRRSCEVEVINRARQILLQAAAVISNTYDSLESLMHSSAQMPGRKLVFFISDGFLLDTGPRNADPRYKLNQIIDAAQRAGTVIYTIDARGLVSGQLDATNNVPFDPNGRLESTALREIPASQDALNALAADTGGRALRNQNVFDFWVNKILEENSNYYLLAWRPNIADGVESNFHNIKVSIIGRPELTVRLPRGLLSARAGAPATGKTSAQGEALKSPPEELREALGAFYPRREVPTSLSVTYLDMPGHGVILTASMQVADDGLMFEAADGRQTAAVDVAGVVLNEKGKQVGSFQKRLQITPIASDDMSQRRFGTIYNYRLPLTPGLYQVRVAARDSKSGHVGSAVRWVEVPDLSLRRLALSSLLIGGREVKPTGTKSERAAMPEMQFSVDHRFARNSRLPFIIFIYNAARGASASARPDVSLQAQIMRGGQPVLTLPPREVNLQEKDSARIPYGGEIPLSSIAPGNYILEVTVTDRIAGTKAAQQINITVE